MIIQSTELSFILAILSDISLSEFETKFHLMNWNLVVEMAIRHRVYPIVYPKLAQIKEIPASTLARLKQQVDNNKFKTLQLAHESVKLVKQLEQRNVQSLIIKGLPLALQVYVDITLRPCKDIDLVVNPKDLAVCCETLESLGYARISPAFELTPWRLKYYIKNFREYIYVNKTTGVCIEPHWKVDYFSATVPLFTHRQYLSFYKQDLPVMSNEDNFIYLVLHGAIHCYWRLRWLNDIAQILKQGLSINWQVVQNNAKAQGVLPIVHQGIILAHQLLHAPIPTILESGVDKDKKAHKLARMAQKFIYSNSYTFEGNIRHPLFYVYRYYSYSILPNWSSRFKFMFADVFKIERTIATVNLPDNIAYLYYLIHPFLFFSRLFKRK